DGEALVMWLIRAQVQQEPSAVTSEGTGINITCSLPHTERNDYIYWYRQFPGRGPAFIGFIHEGSKELHDLAGQLSVSADRRSSTLRLARPRYGDAAVYYCASSMTSMQVNQNNEFTHYI
uniref:Ig-like domain-containing protein n=1 Tax=Meleagris gallopavo TaxID=9103 RepID=A0A803Y6N6_MELGA